MINSFKRLGASLMPIVGMALFVILFIAGLFVFSYLLILGAIVGVVLFSIAFVRSKLHRRKSPTHSSGSGRIIEHEPTQEDKNLPPTK